MLHDWCKPYSNARGPVSVTPFALAAISSFTGAILAAGVGFSSSLEDVDSAQTKFISPWTGGTGKCAYGQLSVNPGPERLDRCASGDLIGGDPSSIFLELRVLCGVFAFVFLFCFILLLLPSTLVLPEDQEELSEHSTQERIVVRDDG